MHSKIHQRSTHSGRDLDALAARFNNSFVSRLAMCKRSLPLSFALDIRLLLIVDLPLRLVEIMLLLWLSMPELTKPEGID